MKKYSRRQKLAICYSFVAFLGVFVDVDSIKNVSYSLIAVGVILFNLALSVYLLNRFKVFHNVNSTPRD